MQLALYSEFSILSGMPELPEVETIAQDLRDAGLVGRKITGLHLLWPKTLAKPTPEEFVRRTAGQTIVSVERRAKYIVLALSNKDSIFIHLRMTGQLSIVPKKTPQKTHDRLCLELDKNDELRFHDTRKFGRWILTDNPEEVTAKLGPEPLQEGFTVDELAKMIKKKSRQIKPLLLDQSFIAGMGNIYVDEALWEAKIHPQALSSKLSKKEIGALLLAIKKVLERGIMTQGTTLGEGKVNYYRLDGSQGGHQHRLNVFRRTGKPCPRCGTIIKRMVVGQRSTHYCPRCQAKE